MRVTKACTNLAKDWNFSSANIYCLRSLAGEVGFIQIQSTSPKHWLHHSNNPGMANNELSQIGKQRYVRVYSTKYVNVV